MKGRRKLISPKIGFLSASIGLILVIAAIISAATGNYSLLFYLFPTGSTLVFVGTVYMVFCVHY